MSAKTQPAIGVETVDVLIAGSGAAGMRAAIAAHDAGASVALLAKGPARATITGGRSGPLRGSVW